MGPNILVQLNLCTIDMKIFRINMYKVHIYFIEKSDLKLSSKWGKKIIRKLTTTIFIVSIIE